MADPSVLGEWGAAVTGGATVVSSALTLGVTRLLNARKEERQEETRAKKDEELLRREEAVGKRAEETNIRLALIEQKLTDLTQALKQHSELAIKMALMERDMKAMGDRLPVIERDVKAAHERIDGRPPR